MSFKLDDGFYLIIGKQGSGKTLFMMKLLDDNYQRKRKIFSNVTLKKHEFERVDLNTILTKLQTDRDYFNDSIILLDEIHIYFDSLDFMHKNNRMAQSFFSQIRKRRILLIATTQYIMNVDVRIRRQCSKVYEMFNLGRGYFQIHQHYVDGYINFYETSYRYNLKPYYNYYDTYEIIDK